jgi:dihydrofolate reductase
MRKVKLQMQMTVDGFVAGPEGQLDWMTFSTDEKLLACINHLIDTSDTILMGRKMTPGFIGYWEPITTQPKNAEYSFAKKMVDTPKVVFSKTLSHMEGKNVRVEKGDLVEAVRQLKQQPGKDILVYGGATLVSSLIEHGLIDELHFFVNPIAIGNGMRIFKGKTPLTQFDSVLYSCGTVVNSYKPR